MRRDQFISVDGCVCGGGYIRGRDQYISVDGGVCGGRGRVYHVTGGIYDRTRRAGLG